MWTWYMQNMSFDEYWSTKPEEFTWELPVL
jgi:hypothetical protein